MATMATRARAKARAKAKAKATARAGTRAQRRELLDPCRHFPSLPGPSGNAHTQERKCGRTKPSHRTSFVSELPAPNGDRQSRWLLEMSCIWVGNTNMQAGGCTDGQTKRDLTAELTSKAQSSC